MSASGMNRRGETRDTGASSAAAVVRVVSVVKGYLEANASIDDLAVSGVPHLYAASRFARRTRPPAGLQIRAVAGKID
jgi:hypothetical protein